MGIMIYLYNSTFKFFKPPTSSKVVLGISVNPYFLRIGCTNFNDFIKFSLVKTIGDPFVYCRTCSAASFNNITKSAAIKPEVDLASYIICVEVRLC
jgi:hypothetical protein